MFNGTKTESQDGNLNTGLRMNSLGLERLLFLMALELDLSAELRNGFANHR